MNNGMRTVIYPVGDIAKAKALFGKLLGAERSWRPAPNCRRTSGMSAGVG